MKLCDNLFFLRHLRTENNANNVISGQSDARIIQEASYQIDLNLFDKIYCSPSLRCIETIKLIDNNFDGLNNIVYDRRLLERSMGLLEGLPKSESKRKYPELFLRGAFNVFRTPPQGECFESFQQRIQEIYNDLLNENRQRNILVCSHNQTLKLLRLMVLDKEVTQQSWIEFSFKNGVITQIKR